MAYLLPVDEILAFKKGNTREKGEGGIDQIEGVAYPADTGVG